MNVIEFAATAMGELLADRVQLGSKPTVIAAPPSQVAEYPTIAVWIEETVEDYMAAFPALTAPDGSLIAGASATDDDLNVIDGDVAVLAPGVTATGIGVLHCAGRLWAGSRYVGKREEVQWAITAAFNQDDSAPGRLLVPIGGARIGDFTLHFGMAAADIGKSSWAQEYAFEARLWAWRPFTLDIPIFVSRTDPLATKMVLEFTQDTRTVVDQPSDVGRLTDLEKYLIARGADPTLTAI